MKYGFKLDEFKEQDYVFGASLPFEEINPKGDWLDFLPVREEQNLNGIETYACVTFTTLNAIEMLIKAKYGLERNYSDRFLAAISGTKEGGNTPNAVAEFLRKVGVVGQLVWPFSPDINTFEKFYSPVPPKLYELAKEFNNEWEFKHENVPSDNEAIEKALKCSPLGISVVAWNERNGKYFQPQGMSDNHFTTLISVRNGDYKRVFDSYADGAGDPFLKDYEWNTTHSAIKRFYIKKKLDEVTEYKKTNWFMDILRHLTFWK